MVGDILRAEREKQGLTIDDVTRETSIREIYLEAIEKGDYDALPGDVYAKGFIRNYSRFLQIDGDALLQKYDEERNITKVVQPVDMPKQPEKEASGHGLFGHSKAREIATVQENSPKAAADNQSDKPKTNLFAAGDAYRNSLEQEKKSGSKKFMILLGVMFVFLGGIYVAFMDDGTEEAPKQETVQTETVQPAPVEKKYDGVEITATALADCWISVKVDGATVFEGTVPQGKDMSWQGKESVDILAGNAGGIQITFNGKDVGTLGEQGQVAERSFKKNESATPAANAPAQQETVQPAYVESSSHDSHYSAPIEPEPQAPAAQEEAAPAAAPVAEQPATPAQVPAPQPVEQSASAPAAAPQN